jgi:hypothetical protein
VEVEGKAILKCSVRGSMGLKRVGRAWDSFHGAVEERLTEETQMDC